MSFCVVLSGTFARLWGFPGDHLLLYGIQGSTNIQILWSTNVFSNL